MSHISTTIHGITDISVSPIESDTTHSGYRYHHRRISIHTADAFGNHETVEIRCFGPEPFEVMELEEG